MESKDIVSTSSNNFENLSKKGPEKIEDSSHECTPDFIDDKVVQEFIDIIDDLFKDQGYQ